MSNEIISGNLIYTLNGGDRYEEWFRNPAKIVAGHKATVTLPAGTTHYVMNLIDENNFLRSYPDLPDMITLSKTKAKYSAHALSAKPPLKTNATQ